jgi:hypothetical protein
MLSDFLGDFLWHLVDVFTKTSCHPVSHDTDLILSFQVILKYVPIRVDRNLF